MKYAQLNETNDVATEVPTDGPVAWDANNFCTAEALVKDGLAAQFRVVPLTVTEAPVIDPVTQTVVRDGLELVGEEWCYKWRIDNLSEIQIAANLVALKTNKNAEINTARLAANFTTFAHAGKTIACDQLSRSDIDGTNGFVSLYGALPPGWPGGWKAVDNTYVVIATVDAWKSFYASLFAAGNNNFAHAQTLKATLAAATTAEQINAIKWSVE